MEEQKHGLPAGLLTAIGDVEAGRQGVTGRLEAWPWTVQSGNQPRYFNNKLEAVAWVEDAIARGVTSIDVGCLQINLLYHSHAFETLDAAFDPDRNAEYAAQFLRHLYASTGDWRQATGLYHSQTKALAAPYETRVERRLSDLAKPPLSSIKQSDTLARLSSAWQATLARAESPLPFAGNDWSILLHGRTSSAGTLRHDTDTKRCAAPRGPR